MEMKLNLKDAKLAGKRGAQLQPMEMLHGWGVKSDHAYLAGFAALGLAVAGRIVSGRNHVNGKGWSHLLGQAAPVFFLVGLGLKRNE